MTGLSIFLKIKADEEKTFVVWIENFGSQALIRRILVGVHSDRILRQQSNEELMEVCRDANVATLHQSVPPLDKYCKMISPQPGCIITEEKGTIMLSLPYEDDKQHDCTTCFVYMGGLPGPGGGWGKKYPLKPGFELQMISYVQIRSATPLTLYYSTYLQ